MRRHKRAAARVGSTGGTNENGAANSRSQSHCTTRAHRAQGRGWPIRAANGKVVGVVRAQTMYKRLSRSRHFLRVPPAIAFDEVSLHEAERLGAKWAEVEEKEGGRLYRVSIADIWRLGFLVRRGHGEQIGLGLRHWQVGGRDAPRQLSLFEVRP